MDELEFALEHIDSGAFEDLTMAFLRAEGYTVHESGRPGADGGWDARVQFGERTGIAHASTEQRWKRKLRDDAESVAELEKKRDESYGLLVFVTSQNVKGTQELDLEDEISNDYGWTLKIYHRKNLIGEIRQNSPELADKFLGVDIGTDHDLLRDIERLRDERVEQIQKRKGPASGLADGPVVALHIIPSGIFSQTPIRTATNIPDPTAIGQLVPRVETRGKSKLAIGRFLTEDEYTSYGLQQNDGLFESASQEMIGVNRKTGEMWLSADIGRRRTGLDAGVIIAVQQTLSGLIEMGFSGSVQASVSIIDGENAKLSTNSTGRLFDPPTLGSSVYSTMLFPIPIAEDGIISDIEPMLSELWREFGHEEGTTNIEDGKWTGKRVSINREVLLNTGDR